MREEEDPLKWYQRPKFKFFILVFVLVVIQVGFGSYAVIVRKFAQASNTDPLVFSFLRDSACFPILWGVAVFLEGVHRPQLKHVPLFALLGLTGMFGNQVLFIYGLYFTSSTVASIFQPLIPVITAAFAMIVRLEPFVARDWGSWIKLWGICTSGGGAIIMVTAKGSFSVNSQAFIGYLLLLGNTSCMAIYVILQKKYLFTKDKYGKDVSLYPPISCSAWAYFFGALSMGIAAVPYSIIHPNVWNLTLEILPPLMYAIFISSAMCYGLINYAASLTSATVVTAFWPLQVPVATIEGFFVFGEAPVWEEYIGALFIIFGLIAVCWVKFSQEKQQQQQKLINEETQ
jgi:drug/metabolite transporter (DMT)-like permease